MADTPQSLIEFITNILSDMDSGALTAHEALAAGSQYGYLRELFDIQADQLSQAELISDAAFAMSVRSAFQGAFTQIGGLANFQNQTPDMPASEEVVRAIATLRKAAIERIRTDGAARLAPYQERRRAFIHALVEKYSTNEKIINTALSQAETATTKNEFADSLVASIGGGSPKTIQTMLSGNTEYISAAVGIAHSQKEMLDVIFTNLGVTRPDVVVDMLLNHPVGESIKNTKIRALKLAGVAADLEVNAKPFPTSRGFFAPGVARGITAGAQAAANGIFSLMGEPLQKIVLKEKVSGSLRTMFSNTQSLIDRLGESFVQSNAFAQLTAGLNRSLGDKTTTSQARGVVDDIFSTIFRGPLGSTTAKSTRERLFNFFEIARANANAPKGLEFLPPDALPWNIFSDTPGLTRSYGSVNAPGNTGGGGYSIKARMPFLGFLGGGLLGGFGSWIGNIASSGFDQALSFFMSSPRIATEIGRSRRSAGVPTPFFADMPKLLATVVVVTILLLFVLPSPLNGPLLDYSAKVSGLLASLSDGIKENTNATIGQVTQTCANIGGVHIWQIDPRWAATSCSAIRPDVPACKAVNTACRIGPSGCGSASATMILNSFGVNTDVVTVWNKQHQDSGYAYYPPDPVLYSCASYWSGVTNLLTDAGLSVSDLGTDLGEVENVLKACGLVLAIVDEKWANGGPTGHIIVITGISQEGGVTKVTTLDPMRPPGFVSTVTDNPTSPGDVHIRGLFGVVK